MAERMTLLTSIEVVVLDESKRLFRIVPSRDAAGFEDAFRSHYELGRPPRGPEDRAAAIHMGLSMFDREHTAAALAARVPKLGGHIATMELQPGLGICVAKTGGPHHWSVWGRPPQLVSCVAAVEPGGA